MKYQCTLKFPGTILHSKRGRIDLCKCSQQELKEMYEDGCSYIEELPGNPPIEKPIDTAETPNPKRVTKVNKKSKTISTEEPKEDTGDSPEDSKYITETETENPL